MHKPENVSGTSSGTFRLQELLRLDEFFTAIEDYRALIFLQEQLKKTHFMGRRGAFQAEHVDELKRLRNAIYLREKFSKKLGVSLPLDKASAKKLKYRRRELTNQNESLRLKLGQIQAKLDHLSKLCYWTHKAIPDALADREDFSEQMEARAETGHGRCHRSGDTGA